MPATDLTHIAFTDGADLHVICVDGHNIAAIALDIQEHGVIVDYNDGQPDGLTTRNFLPWHFIQSINERY